MGKLFTRDSAHTGSVESEVAKLRAAAVAIQKIRLSAQRELELARQTRTAAQRYMQEAEAKARSQAQQLMLRTRIATRETIQKEIEELVFKDLEEPVHKALSEMQKMLADVRAIRITAQEELAAMKKFADAARIYSLSPIHREYTEPQEETIEPEEQEEKQPVRKEGKRKKQLVGKK